jgi:hypothetical protein
MKNKRLMTVFALTLVTAQALYCSVQKDPVASYAECRGKRPSAWDGKRRAFIPIMCAATAYTTGYAAYKQTNESYRISSTRFTLNLASIVTTCWGLTLLSLYKPVRLLARQLGQDNPHLSFFTRYGKAAWLTFQHFFAFGGLDKHFKKHIKTKATIADEQRLEELRKTQVNEGFQEQIIQKLEKHVLVLEQHIPVLENSVQILENSVQILKEKVQSNGK